MQHATTCIDKIHGGIPANMRSHCTSLWKSACYMMAETIVDYPFFMYLLLAGPVFVQKCVCRCECTRIEFVGILVDVLV